MNTESRISFRFLVNFGWGPMSSASVFTSDSWLTLSSLLFFTSTFLLTRRLSSLLVFKNSPALYQSKLKVKWKLTKVFSHLWRQGWVAHPPKISMVVDTQHQHWIEWVFADSLARLWLSPTYFVSYSNVHIISFFPHSDRSDSVIGWAIWRSMEFVILQNTVLISQCHHWNASGTWARVEQRAYIRRLLVFQAREEVWVTWTFLSSISWRAFCNLGCKPCPSARIWLFSWVERGSIFQLAL